MSSDEARGTSAGVLDPSRLGLYATLIVFLAGAWVLLGGGTLRAADALAWLCGGTGAAAVLTLQLLLGRRRG